MTPIPLSKNRQTLLRKASASNHEHTIIPHDLHCLNHSFLAAERTTGRNATFFQSLAFDKDLGATRGIDAALKQNNVDALVLPAAGRTTVPAGN